MKMKGSVLLLTALLVAVSAVFGFDTSKSDPDQPIPVLQCGWNNLQPVTVAPATSALLQSKGVELRSDDPTLPGFLERLIELAGFGLSDSEEISVSGMDLQVTIDTNQAGAVIWINEIIEYWGLIGQTPAVFKLQTTESGYLNFSLTKFPGKETSQTDFQFRLLQTAGDDPGGPIFIGGPGKCKCSKDGVTGCTNTMCEDGDTCPGHNGHSCGFYTCVV